MKIFVLSTILMVSQVSQEYADGMGIPKEMPKQYVTPTIDLFGSQDDCLRAAKEWEHSSDSFKKHGISRRVIDRCSEHELSGSWTILSNRLR